MYLFSKQNNKQDEDKQKPKTKSHAPHRLPNLGFLSQSKKAIPPEAFLTKKDDLFS